MTTTSQSTNGTENEGALAGLRVLDVGLILQGPQAAMLLGELGADVIKIEIPEVGDQSRWIPFTADDLRAPWYIGCNRGKRGMTLDLRTEQGKEIFLKLVDTADIIISNFLPGTMDRWGIGYADLSARNPGIIMGMGSAYGPLGPDSTRKGADLGGQAAGGLISTMGHDDDSRHPVGATIADHIGCLNLTAGVLAALQARHRTGRGQQVEVSLYGGQIYAQASEMTSYFLRGKQAGPARSGHPYVAGIYGVFPTADGHIAIVGVTPDKKDQFWSLLGRPDLASIERFDEAWLAPEIKAELFVELEDAFSKQSSAYWEDKLRAAEIRYSPVRDYAAVAADEGAYVNGYLQRVSHPEWGDITMPGNPIRMSDTPTTAGVVAPELGEHTEEVLLEVGYSWEDIATFRDANAI